MIDVEEAHHDITHCPTGKRKKKKKTYSVAASVWAVADDVQQE